MKIITTRNQNQKQDLEMTLQLVTRAIKDMAAMSQAKRQALDKLLPKSLLMVDKTENSGKVEEPGNAENNLEPCATPTTGR